jgi:hypothetical protein
MSDDTTQVMGWPAIIGIMIAFGLAVGLILGLIGRVVQLPQSMTTGGVGVAMGVVGALLISRRRAAMARRAIG